MWKVRDVLVNGGTVRLGRRVVDRLRDEGIERREMSWSGRPGTIKGVAVRALASARA